MMTTQDEITARIQSRSALLTGSEARLIAELMRAPREIALATAAEFAGRVGVHEATTSRLARKLDFPSYGAFRDALQREYLHRSEPAHRMSTTLDTAGGNHLGHLIRAELTALDRLSDHVADHDIARAAEALHGRRVMIFAQGHATALGALAERRLRRMGIEARLLGGSARDLAEGALSITGADAVLAFAIRRQPRHYPPLMQTAQAAGAATLVIADTIGPALHPAPTHLLAAPRAGLPGGFQTLNIPMLLLNALILALGERSGTTAIDTLDRLGTLIARFESDAS